MMRGGINGLLDYWIDGEGSGFRRMLGWRRFWKSGFGDWWIEGEGSGSEAGVFPVCDWRVFAGAQGIEVVRGMFARAGVDVLVTPGILGDLIQVGAVPVGGGGGSGDERAEPVGAGGRCRCGRSRGRL